MKHSLEAVVRQFARIAIIGALCCAIGLHWVVLQSFAWTNMLIEYSKGASLCQAIAQTFDGAHPCSLCHIVAKGKAAEKETNVQSPVPKIDIICVARVIRLISPVALFDYTVRHFSISEVQHSPPVPPPRVMAG